jgi:hypothetical protein
MELMERTSDRRRTFMKDRLERKLEDTMRDKARLEQANELLKAEIERDNHERDQMWSAVEKGIRPRKSRMRRLMLLGVGAGVAYVAGAKAGRDRYDDIVAWWNRTRGRAVELPGEAKRTMTAQADKVATQAEKLTDKLSDRVETATARTGEAIESGGEHAASTMRGSVRNDPMRDGH